MGGTRRHRVAYPEGVRIELPDDYVPPQPTHPTYGYLTPEELEDFEAQERIRLGIVPSVQEGELGELGDGEQPVGPVAAARVPRSSRAPDETPKGSAEWTARGLLIPDEVEVSRRRLVREPVSRQPGEDETAGKVTEVEVLAEPEQVVEAPGYASGGWLPSEPVVEEPTLSSGRPLPEAPATVLGQVTDYTWDAYRQEWVSRTANRVAPTSSGGGRQVVLEEPNVDVAAAAGGRGATSSWTSADGQTYRWDARGQRWIVERPSA